jgi:hypothetical protein
VADERRAAREHAAVERMAPHQRAVDEELSDQATAVATWAACGKARPSSST